MISEAQHPPDLSAQINAKQILRLAPGPFAVHIRMEIAAGMWHDADGLLEPEEWPVVSALAEASPAQLEALDSADLRPLLLCKSAVAREAAFHALAHVSHGG